MADLEPGEFKVEYDGASADDAGNINASDGERNVIVQASPGEKSWVRHRVAMGFGGVKKRILIVELKGVRLYVHEDTYILSTQDVYHSPRE